MTTLPSWCSCDTVRPSGASAASTPGAPTSHSRPTVNGGRRPSGGRSPLAVLARVHEPAGAGQETCRLAGLGDHAEVRDDLIEWDYGEYEGRTTADIRLERPGLVAVGRGPAGRRDGRPGRCSGRSGDRRGSGLAGSGRDVCPRAHPASADRALARPGGRCGAVVCTGPRDNLDASAMSARRG